MLANSKPLGRLLTGQHIRSRNESIIRESSHHTLYQTLRHLSLSIAQRSDDAAEFKPKKPKLYFDLYKFKCYLKRRKREIKTEEMLHIMKQTIRPPPKGWTVATFIQEVGFDSDHQESFIQAFKTWESLMLWDPKAARELGGTDSSQRLKLRRKVQLFLHGLWPKKILGTALENFQAPPLLNEGREWSKKDDQELERLAKSYDINFGDPWLYISWEMQRNIHDVHQRYLQIFHIPQCIQRRCEFLISKSAEPLRINSDFKIVPPFIYLIPSEYNFRLTEYPLEDKSQNENLIPSAFQRYRRSDCFTLRKQSTFEWHVGEEPESRLSSIAVDIRRGRKSRGQQKGRLWKEVLQTDLPSLRQRAPLAGSD